MKEKNPTFKTEALLYLLIFLIGAVKVYASDVYYNNSLKAILLCLFCVFLLFISEIFIGINIQFERKWIWHIPSIMIGIYLLYLDLKLIINVWNIRDLNVILYSLIALMFFVIYFKGLWKHYKKS